MRMFSDDAEAEARFAEQRWGGKPVCPRRGCNNVQIGTFYRIMPYRCRNRRCEEYISVPIGTAKQDTKLSYQTWAMAIYILESGI